MHYIFWFSAGERCSSLCLDNCLAVYLYLNSDRPRTKKTPDTQVFHSLVPSSTEEPKSIKEVWVMFMTEKKESTSLRITEVVLNI